MKKVLIILFGFSYAKTTLAISRSYICDMYDCSESAGSSALGDLLMVVLGCVTAYHFFTNKKFRFALLIALGGIYFSALALLEVKREHGMLPMFFVGFIIYFIASKVLNFCIEKKNVDDRNVDENEGVLPKMNANKDVIHSGGNADIDDFARQKLKLPTSSRMKRSDAATPSLRPLENGDKASSARSKWVRCSVCGQLTAVEPGCNRLCSYCGTNAPILDNGSVKVSRVKSFSDPWLRCTTCGQLTHVPPDTVKLCGYCGDSSPALRGAGVPTLR